MVALLLFAGRLRPSRRRTREEAAANQVPAPETPVAGSYESGAGSHSTPPGVHEPISSPWPMVVAGAIAFTAFGLITNYAFTLFGGVVLIVGIVGWLGEMIRE